MPKSPPTRVDTEGLECAEATLLRLVSETAALPDLSQLTRRPASEGLRFNLVDVLCAYCRVLRTFNGHWMSDPATAASMLIASSSVLDADERHSSISTVLEQCCARAIDVPAGQARSSYVLAQMDDVKEILKEPRLVLCALQDAWNLFNEAASFAKLKKKLWFFLLWANSAPAEWIQATRTEVSEELNRAVELQDHPGGYRSDGAWSGSVQEHRG